MERERAEGGRRGVRGNLTHGAVEISAAVSLDGYVPDKSAGPENRIWPE
jgi:hypothetical protein